MNLPNPVAWLCTDFDGHYGIGVTKELAKSKAGEYCNDYLPLHPESAFTAFQSRIEALEAELAACKRDAERYLWLRLWGARNGTPELYVSDGNNPIYEQRLDAAIDAAIAAQEKHEKDSALNCQVGRHYHHISRCCDLQPKQDLSGLGIANRDR